MKSMFYKTLCASVATLFTCSSLVAGTSPLYENFVEVTDPPQIDAAAFANYGSFDIFTDLPFSSINTVNYTNQGTLVGAPGFQLDYDLVSGGGRQPAGNIINNGTILAEDSSGFFLFSGADGNFFLPGAGSASWLRLNATNIYSRGLLSAGQNGLLEINGQNIDLSRAGVRTGVSPNSGSGGSSDFLIDDGTNFVNAPGILDNYWATGTNQALVTDRGQPLVLNGFPPELNTPNPFTPSHEISTVLGSSNSFSRVALPYPGGFSTNRYNAYVYENELNSTSTIIQVVFVATNINNGDVVTSTRFGPGGNGSVTPIVRISARNFDTSLDRYLTNSVYVSDRLASLTNNFISANLTSTTGRPLNYRVATSAPFGWFLGSAGNANFNYFRHIWDFRWTFAVVTNQYSAYSFALNSEVDPDTGFGFFGAIPRRGFNLGNPFIENFADPTNSAGKVNLESGGFMNLERTRIRGERYASVKSPDVLIDSNTIFDAPVLSLDLGSTSTNEFHIKDAIPEKVQRISGKVYCWSAGWTNNLVTFEFDPDTGTQSSNVVIIRNYVTFVDAENLGSVQNVLTTDLLLNAGEIQISDNVVVDKSLEFTSRDVTIDARIALSDNIPDLGAANFVGTVNLMTTTNGNVINEGETLLGPGFEPQLAMFSNEGRWSSGSILVDLLSTNGSSSTFTNSGTLYSTGGPLTVNADMIDLRGGESLANGNITLTGKQLSSAGSTVSAGLADNTGFVRLGKISINVSDSVDDGSVANNNWNATDGFEMLMKPATGDFANTRLTSFATQFSEVKHKWGAEDRGADPDGYVDNAAVGHLVLDGENLSLFTFQPATSDVGVHNAMYVGFLDLRDYTETNPEEGILIEDRITIYFGDSNAADNQALADRVSGLVYLPASTVPTVTQITLANGQLFNAESDLLNSALIDSDADGLVNSIDSTPFDDVRIEVVVTSGPESQTVISWIGAPLTEYQLEYKDNVDAGEWDVLSNMVTMSDQREVSVVDDATDSNHRYYRVIYTP